MAGDPEPSNSLSEPSETLDFDCSPQEILKIDAVALTFSRKGKEKIENETLAASLSRKGDDKIEIKQDKEEIGSTICGICLSEDGKAIRGKIDCCDHYFCFVCIMEWAKVESRCPMCKERFKTIHRPVKQGTALRERFVNVPVRNQVYDSFGNLTVGISDPYANVFCFACKGSEDESLLLLCDLCDSAAHTYCVGLGATVPEGDWYCHDCSVSMNELSYAQKDSDSCEQDFSWNFGLTQVTEATVSISDNVWEETFSDVLLPQRPAGHPQRGKRRDDERETRRRVVRMESQGNCSPELSSSSRVIARKVKGRPSNASSPEQSSSSRVFVREVTVEPSNLQPSQPEQGARTLSRCRDLHDRIEILRANWNALQSGTMRFSSGCFNSGSMRGNIRNSREVASGRTSRSNYVAPVNFDEKGSTSNDRESTRDLYDVNKAWKMMKVAKSLQGDHKGARMENQRNAQKDAKNKSSSFSAPTNKPLGQNELGTAALQNTNKNHSVEVVYSNRRSAMRENQEKNIGINDKWDLKSVELDSHRESGGQICQQILHGAPHWTTTLDSLQSSDGVSGSQSRVSDLSLGRIKPVTTSGSKIKQPLENSIADMNVLAGEQAVLRKDDASKSHIQSLVKLNLKLLSQGKHLGVDRFKEIARLATHTILAACRLEHSRSFVRPCPTLICKHSEQEQFRPSDLMPGSCRECFYFFVKDVINTIFVDKARLV